MLMHSRASPQRQLLQDLKLRAGDQEDEGYHKIQLCLRPSCSRYVCGARKNTNGEFLRTRMIALEISKDPWTLF